MKKDKLFFAFLILFLIISIFSFETIARDDIADFSLMAENSYLKLYINQQTTEIAVQEKASANIWFSSPQELARLENRRRGSARERMKAPLKLSYIRPAGDIRTLDAYNDSIVYDQFSIEQLETGVKVNYTLRREWQADDYLPLMVEKDRFESLVLNKIEDDFDRELFMGNYALLTLQEREEYPYEFEELRGINLKNLLGNYKLMSLSEATDSILGTITREREKHQVLIRTFIETIFENRRDIDSWIGVRSRDLDPFRGTSTYVLLEGTFPRWDREDMINILQEKGYTPEDVINDHMRYNLDLPQPTPTFNLTVNYYLDGKDLVVNIPGSEIKYPVNVIKDEQRVDLPVYSVELFKFFGAASVEDEGYIFVPDGSGALINLNRQQTYVPPYQSHVYGPDLTVMPRTEMRSQVEKIRMPVFALKKTDRAFLAIIEEGESLARIKASTSGQNTSFNNVNAEFLIRRKGEIQITGDDIVSDNIYSVLTNYQQKAYSDDLQIRYKFLQGTEADYMGMAAVYRDYLIDKFGLEKLANTEEIPLYIELFGGIEKDALVSGLPGQVVQPVTTYNQVSKILQEFKNEGIDNINLKYTGWSAGGVKHDYPARVNLEKRLGSEGDFQELLAYLQENEIGFYPDVSFLNVYQNSFFNGFSVSRDAARFLNWETAFLYDYDLATFQRKPDTARYVLTATSLPALMESFLADYQSYNYGGLSFRYLADQLTSDFREKRVDTILREESKNIIKEQLAGVKNQDIEFILQGGNVYALPYSNTILGIPVADSNYEILDQTIPFYQIVLHGYFNYSGQPFNVYGEDWQDNFLFALQTGQLPYYRGFFEESSIVKDTLYNNLFAGGYQDWIAEAVTIYHKLNPLLSKVHNRIITDYRKIAEGVYKTVYEDEIAVIVNYNSSDFLFEDYNIQGKSYLWLEGDDLK